MKSPRRGRRTSRAVEILNISPHGIWILVGDRELFMDRHEFPWFADATVSQIERVELRGDAEPYLRWPDLDVDLAVSSLAAPEQFPLKYRR